MRLYGPEDFIDTGIPFGKEIDILDRSESFEVDTAIVQSYRYQIDLSLWIIIEYS